jgi:hypothetical protein
MYLSSYYSKLHSLAADGDVLLSHGVRLSPLGTAATVWPGVPAPDDNVPMIMIVEQSVECELVGETKVLVENLPSAILSTTDPM